MEINSEGPLSNKHTTLQILQSHCISIRIYIYIYFFFSRKRRDHMSNSDPGPNLLDKSLTFGRGIP
jgi:hypothetical protein